MPRHFFRGDPRRREIVFFRYGCAFQALHSPVCLMYHFLDMFVNRKSFSFSLGADFRIYDP